jgi:hypothetical protein
MATHDNNSSNLQVNEHGTEYLLYAHIASTGIEHIGICWWVRLLFNSSTGRGGENPPLPHKTTCGCRSGRQQDAMTLLIKSGLLCSPQIVDSPRAVSSTSAVETTSSFSVLFWRVSTVLVGGCGSLIQQLFIEMAS